MKRMLNEAALRYILPGVVTRRAVNGSHGLGTW